MNKHPLWDMLEPVVEQQGYELIRVLTIGVQNPTLQVMIDRRDGLEVTVDDCAKVSRVLSDVLDEKDPMENRYSLEVSSPGIDRPLTKPEHFKRFAGYEAKIETSVPVEKRKRFKGIIQNIDENGNVGIAAEGVLYELPFNDISKAKIVITEELLRKYEASEPDDEI